MSADRPVRVRELDPVIKSNSAPGSSQGFIGTSPVVNTEPANTIAGFRTVAI